MINYDYDWVWNYYNPRQNFLQDSFIHGKFTKLTAIHGEKDDEIGYSGAEFFLFSATLILYMFICTKIWSSTDGRSWRRLGP